MTRLSSWPWSNRSGIEAEETWAWGVPFPSLDFRKAKGSFTWPAIPYWTSWLVKRSWDGEMIYGKLASHPPVLLPLFFEVFFLVNKAQNNKSLSFKWCHLWIKPGEPWISAWNGDVLFALIKMQGVLGHRGVRNKETVTSDRSLVFMAFQQPEPAVGNLEKPRRC